jgi:hypothetical protein
MERKKRGWQKGEGREELKSFRFSNMMTRVEKSIRGDGCP